LTPTLKIISPLINIGEINNQFPQAFSKILMGKVKLIKSRKEFNTKRN